MKQIALRISDELHLAIKIRAVEEKITMNDLIVQIMEKEIKNGTSKNDRRRVFQPPCVE